MNKEEEQVFIAQAKGRSGWGLHPYTQITTMSNARKEPLERVFSVKCS